MKNIFTDHPHSIGETYTEHMKYASIFGLKMMLGGLGCFIHAFLPFIFKNTGSNILNKLTHDFISRMPAVDEKIVEISRLIESKPKK